MKNISKLNRRKKNNKWNKLPIKPKMLITTTQTNNNIIIYYNFINYSMSQLLNNSEFHKLKNELKN